MKLVGFLATRQLLLYSEFSLASPAKLKVKNPLVLKVKLHSQLKQLLAAKLELKHPLVLTVKLFRFKTEHCSIVVKHQVLT